MVILGKSVDEINTSLELLCNYCNTWVKLRDGGFDLDFRSSVFTGVGEILFTDDESYKYFISQLYCRCTLMMDIW